MILLVQFLDMHCIARDTLNIPLYEFSDDLLPEVFELKFGDQGVESSDLLDEIVFRSRHSRIVNQPQLRWAYMGHDNLT